ncbi:NmrA family NAD(P)-binding protein [Nocardia asteroides]|uniref:NAD(P)H-binding protein n=1 Tax=Nocardia asteroides TaxID=1824 RepID=UPI001E3E0579|nr:NmrA family NAD(P)-binding protein [Nocardia asteroides]UGT64739.1 NAD(P)H-binding protein [Nocardia asteroides]
MTVAVTGASGQLGRLVVEALARQGAAPIAIARTPEKIADLAERGIEVRRAAYDDPDQLDAALAGVTRLLLVSGNEFGQRVAQHTAVLRAAERAGVELLAYTSIPDADTTPLILANEHRATEEILRAGEVPLVLLRNGWYWENYLGSLQQAKATGAFAGAAAGGRVAGAARADYAEAAAAVLTADNQGGRVYELGGDQPLTHAELAQAMAAALGTPVRYESLGRAGYTAALIESGLPAPAAEVFADSDAGIEAGALDVTTGDLVKLIGRPAATAESVFRAAL